MAVNYKFQVRKRRISSFTISLRTDFGCTKSMRPYLIAIRSKNIIYHFIIGSPSEFLRSDKPRENLFSRWDLTGSKVSEKQWL